MIAFRLLVLCAVWLLGTSTLSLAQEGSQTPSDPGAGTTAPGQSGKQATEALLVPDLRGLPYVFAKGVLEDAGFAWRVKGKVRGFATDLVAKQSAKPGTRVLDTGAPTLVLGLKANPGYEEIGLPDGTSPYAGTRLVLASSASVAQSAALPQEEAQHSGDSSTGRADAASSTSGDLLGSPSGQSAEPGAATVPEAPPPTSTLDAPNAAETTGSVEAEGAGGSGGSSSSSRPPAFRVPGAPSEPLGEMTLPNRALLLGAWLAKQAKMTPAAWNRFTYQHAWVVTGAKFGWWHGAAALRILIRVDEQLQGRFGSGAASKAVARSALAQVLRKSQGK